MCALAGPAEVLTLGSRGLWTCFHHGEPELHAVDAVEAGSGGVFFDPKSRLGCNWKQTAIRLLGLACLAPDAGMCSTIAR